MASHGGDAANGLDGTGGPAAASGVSADELRARFQDQGRPGLAEDRGHDARRARGMYAALAGLVAVICLVLIVVRLVGGDALGAWVATYAVGVAVSGWGFVLARIGRTRWAMAVTCVAAALAGLGDSPAFR